MMPSDRYPRPRNAAILLALIALFILGWGVGSNSRSASAYVVPENVDVIPLPELPENAPGELELKSDTSVFDLRAWKNVPPALAFRKPVSPANYYNYLRVIKRKPCDFLYAHYATGGLRIDLRCVSHSSKIFAAANNLHGQSGDKNYGIGIDISREPLNRVFLVLVQATYWNSFRNSGQEDASTYIDPQGALPEELSLLILFPADKPCTSVALQTATDDGDWQPYEHAREVTRGKRGEYAYWPVSRKKPGLHYGMKWTW